MNEIEVKNIVFFIYIYIQTSTVFPKLKSDYMLKGNKTHGNS